MEALTCPISKETLQPNLIIIDRPLKSNLILELENLEKDLASLLKNDHQNEISQNRTF